MKFIAATIISVLSSAAVCSQDFGASAIFARNTNKNSGFTLYPKLNQHSSTFLPLNILKSSFTHLPSQPPLFSSTSARLLHSASKTGKQLGGYTGGNKGISQKGLSRRTFPPNVMETTHPDLKNDGLIGIRQLLDTLPFTPQLPVGVDAFNAVTVGTSEINFLSIDTGEARTVDDFNHPPHIHSIDVECSKTMMAINIEFNRVFDGFFFFILRIIYSKGYYTDPECVYVKQNSSSTTYSFTINLNSCGTQFINDFEDEARQAYLENVLVLQNEPGIQEAWDAIRRIRCLWEGNINKALTVNISIDMLNQEIVTFSGDTATAKLDIQIGKGPFAPIADGFVKIGETMTLVVSLEGDPDFDLQVRDCLARDESSINMLQLTDKRGCILKPKLISAFQKINNTGASIIAYAFFQAFKFPDITDLFIECNVDLCKTNCEPCPDAN